MLESFTIKVLKHYKCHCVYWDSSKYKAVQSKQQFENCLPF